VIPYQRSYEWRLGAPAQLLDSYAFLFEGSAFFGTPPLSPKNSIWNSQAHCQSFSQAAITAISSLFRAVPW
jgi:hypothetical protein